MTRHEFVRALRDEATRARRWAVYLPDPEAKGRLEEIANECDKEAKALEAPLRQQRRSALVEPKAPALRLQRLQPITSSPANDNDGR